MMSTNPNPTSSAIICSNKASMAEMFSSPATVHFRSTLRRISGIRTLTASFSGDSVLVHSNSKSRNRLMISSTTSPIDVGIEEETEESEEVGKQTLVSFEETTLKFTASQEAFEVYYNKKSMVKAKENAKKADNTRNDLNVITVESIKEGNVYTFVAAEKKNIIMQHFASSTNDSKDVFKVHEFYIGIPYCGLLSLIGFFSFMITGDISCNKFGIILGESLLASSVKSLISWRKEYPSAVVMKGQAAIVSLLFLKQARLMFMIPTFTRCIATIVSAAVLSFYISRIAYSIWQTKLKPSLDTGIEN